MLIEWSQNALNELSDIFAYFLSIEEEEQGKDIVSKLIKSVTQLKSYPHSGRPGSLEGTREIVIRKLPYVLVYEVSSEAVMILHIYHTSRDFPALVLK